jgi:hypothetical protein
MGNQSLSISFNKDWAKSVSKAQFIKVHKDAYPDVDLGAEYDKIVPPAKLDKPDPKEEKK